MQPLSDGGVLAEHRKVALLGGVYSNWLALDAALADARRQGVDGVYFLGDVGGFGPTPDRAVERLRATAGLGVVQGNYDDSVGRGLEDCQCGYTDPRDNHFAQISYDYTLANTSADNRAWLAAMPKAARIRVGGQLVHLCHGSPRKVNEFLWESTTPRGFIDAQLASVGADLIACTHTGIHWERRLADGRGVINVGALGRPANDGRNEVWYTLLEARDGRVHTQFVPVAYDWRALCETMRAEQLPEPFVESIATGWWTTCLEILPARERARGRH